MTFYNVISAVLFLGAFRELLASVQVGDRSALMRAAVLALLDFNDAIYTSWTIETRGKKYGPSLMLIDLVNFTLLAGALVFLNPSGNNIFQLELTTFKPWLTESTFWLLLGIYWVLILVWTWRAGVYTEPKYPRWLIKWAVLIAVFFFLESALVAVLPGLVSKIGRVLAAVYPAMYILGIRNYTLRAGLDPAVAAPSNP